MAKTPHMLSFQGDALSGLLRGGSTGSFGGGTMHEHISPSSVFHCYSFIVIVKTNQVSCSPEHA